MKRLRAEIALIGVTVIWGTTFVVVKNALAEVSTFVFLALRFSVAAIALLLIYRKKVRKDAVGIGLLAGTLLFTAYVFQTLGLELTTPSKSAFLTGLSIPAVPFISSLVYRVKPRSIDLVGIALASVGMVLMTAPPEGWAGINRGDVLSFLCAVTFAFHIVIIGHYTQIYGFETLAAVQVATAAVLGFVLFPFAEPIRFHFTAGVAAAVLVTGLLATALAFTAQAWAQQYTSASRAALIFSLEPPVAWLTSWFVAGEVLAVRGKVGAGMILAGILLVELTRGKFVTIPSVGTSD